MLCNDNFPFIHTVPNPSKRIKLFTFLISEKYLVMGIFHLKSQDFNYNGLDAVLYKIVPFQFFRGEKQNLTYRQKQQSS